MRNRSEMNTSWRDRVNPWSSLICPVYSVENGVLGETQVRLGVVHFSATPWPTVPKLYHNIIQNGGTLQRTVVPDSSAKILEIFSKYGSNHVVWDSTGLNVLWILNRFTKWGDYFLFQRLNALSSLTLQCKQWREQKWKRQDHNYRAAAGMTRKSEFDCDLFTDLGASVDKIQTDPQSTKIKLSNWPFIPEGQNQDYSNISRERISQILSRVDRESDTSCLAL